MQLLGMLFVAPRAVCVAAACILLLSGCGTGKKKPVDLDGVIVITELNGMANDADNSTSASPETHRYSSPTSTAATDGNTIASSDAPHFDRVSCVVHGIPGASASQWPCEAKANNRVLSELVVNQAGSYAFRSTLNVHGVHIAGGGRLDIFIRTNILDSLGLAVGGGALTFQDITLSPDGTKLILNGDSTRTVNLDKDGSCSIPFDSPAPGVTLKNGSYQLENELRVYATAPGLSSHAEAKNVSLTVALH
ncbi:MAG: hypothetical protein JSS75_13340 [Bacteroidetes bacterium]|nr:hypothetical protein [Bacteroidota bacterium]